MQAEGSGPVHFVHSAPPEDHGLKREYLVLLPPQQIIDICLALDIHVPVSLKRAIWPPDLQAAIASAKNIVPKLEETPTPIPPDSTPPDAKPPPPQVKSPDKPPVAGPSTQPVPPLQPYGFPTQPAYPHTPYYQAVPPGYAPYAPYPAYPQPANPFPAGPYEDMIVEGLNAVGDPEGMAPKDLFNWIAARYPVQSNFRPSASQALQKAYRRGRFEKGTNGRYRLNANWEGGNSSTRRATRRPQTNNAPSGLHMNKSRMPALPFTAVAPRTQIRQSAPPPHSASPLQHPSAGAAVQTLPAPAVPSNGIGIGVEAYEAAQNILQTINFGEVTRAADSPVKNEAVSLSLADHARAELQGQLALLAVQMQALAEEGPS
ncbi:hypothetical protein FB45DRAFT_915202 [Roridomyces roridus]|uniref:Histone H1 n=1 Tax=Roridomyces roridus TaxID=1738132 RepID=A0AAD7FNR7_9AGAR|nr:hypothetical protein FB45DRAFT_915202 [Roridomyces roridus]